MRYYLKVPLLALASCFALFCFALHSCGVSLYEQQQQQQLQAQNAELERIRYQAQLRRAYQGVLEMAADRVCLELMKIVSPQSGRNPTKSLELDEIVFYERENIVEVDARLSWQARDFFSGVPYGQCDAHGVIYVYLPRRNTDQAKVTFSYTGHNTHLEQVSSKGNLQRVQQGFTLPLR